MKKYFILSAVIIVLGLMALPFTPFFYFQISVGDDYGDVVRKLNQMSAEDFSSGMSVEVSYEDEDGNVVPGSADDLKHWMWSVGDYVIETHFEEDKLTGINFWNFKEIDRVSYHHLLEYREVSRVKISYITDQLEIDTIKVHNEGSGRK